jgi:hypothetical protein
MDPSEGTPETFTLYSLLHPLDGWTPRASSPSSVREETLICVEPADRQAVRRNFSGSRSIGVATFGIETVVTLPSRLAEKDVRLGPV